MRVDVWSDIVCPWCYIGNARFSRALAEFEHRDEVDDFYARSGSDAWADHAEDLGDLMKRVARLFKAFRRMARHGRLTPSTLKKLRAVLDESLVKMEELVGREPL